MKLLSRKRLIPNTDFSERHPARLFCSTDAQYTKVANEIKDLLKDDFLTFMDEEGLKNLSISLALYFEDIHSGTHQFETFTKLYHEMFGYYVPFYNSKDSKDESADIDAMRFVLWLTIFQEHEGSIFNPRNDSNKDIAEKLWHYWLSVRDSIQPNNDLADFLYCEDTQTNVIKVKNVLIWLQYNSFLGRFIDNPTDENESFGITSFLGKDNDKSLLNYGVQSYSVFHTPSWPLSLRAQDIYAEMIRIEMDDKDDEYAKSISNMVGSEFGIYEIINIKGPYLVVRDYHGKEYNVSLDGFEDKGKSYKKDFKYIISSFIKYGKDWYPNGIYSYCKGANFEEFKEYFLNKYDFMHNHVGQFDKYLYSHDGNRLYFFSNYDEVNNFCDKELDIYNEEDCPTDRRNDPVMLFFEPNGQFTLSFDAVKLVKHPENRFYDKKIAENDCLLLIASYASCSPDALIYIIENGYLPDALLNDIRGKEYGRQTMQENIEFLARCCRRDIHRSTPFSKRKPTTLPEKEGLSIERAMTRFGFRQFVEIIEKINPVISAAYKEWRVVSCDKAVIIVQDVKNKKNYTIGTRDLYEAHLEIEDKDVKVSTVEPFVGKTNAPAASALLYNIVGRAPVFTMSKSEYLLKQKI